MLSKCINCKWSVVGQYSKLYKGCPIGCDCPIDEHKDVSGFGKHCGYEPKMKGEQE